MRKTSLGCLFAILLVIGGCSTPYILHNRNLDRFRSAFRKVPHPPSSNLLVEFSEIGRVGVGNGNSCNYLAGEIRESDEPFGAIKQHYSRFFVPRIDPAGETDFRGTHKPLHVEFPDEEQQLGSIDSDISLEIVDARVKQTKKTLYVVYALDAGYSPNFDLRCH